MSSAKQKFHHVLKLRLAYKLILIVSLLIYDAWNLLAPQAVMHRWIIVGVLTALTLGVLTLVRRKALAIQTAAWIFILVDIAIATFNVYTQRGIAAKAVLLYAIPIITAAIIGSRRTTYITALLSVIAYIGACLGYFYMNPGQAYTVEVYGETAFYSSLLFVLAYGITKNK